MSSPEERGETEPAGSAIGRNSLPTHDPQVPELRCEATVPHLDGGAAERRFNVEELLGAGATGEVYSVRDVDLDRIVALKVLRSALMEREDDRRNFLREARTTAHLAHPNVLPVLDFSLTADGRPFFTMNRIEGRTLLEAMSRSDPPMAPSTPDFGDATPAANEPKDHRSSTIPSPPSLDVINRWLTIAISICHGLSYAHAHGIVHQDVKPDNILIGDFGEVIILDWGSSGRMDDAGRVTTGLYGTPLYMSPEQARSEYSDQRSDIFALGATLFHALIGRLPWWSDDSDTFRNGKRRGDILPPTPAEVEGVPPELLAIISKAMRPDPDERYPSVDEMRQDLEHYQMGLAVSAYRYSLGTRLWRWCRRHRSALGSAGVVVAAAAVIGGFVAHQRMLEHRSWRLVEVAPFTTLAKAKTLWTGYAYTGWGSTEPHQLPITAPLFVIDNGWLGFGSPDDIVDICQRPAILGNIRVEWDYRNPNGHLNLNCFIGGPNRTSAFTFHVGGWGYPDRVILTEGKELRQLEWTTLPEPIEAGRTYHFALERLDRHLRLSLDGRLIMDHLDIENMASEGSQCFGFDTFVGERVEARDVRVYQQTPAQRVSPLEVPDQFYQFGQNAEALRRYQEIVEAYPRSELAVAADFRAALCVDRLGDAAAADDRLKQFVAAHPDHELAPYALAEELVHARALQDQTRIGDIELKLTRYAGNSLLMGVLWQIASDDQRQMPDQDALAQDPQLASAKLLKLAQDVTAWSGRYRVKLLDEGVWESFTHAFVKLGEPQVAWPLLPQDQHRNRAELLVARGRLDDANLEDPGWGLPMLLQGHVAEVANATFDVGVRCIAYAALSQFDNLRMIDPKSYLLACQHLESEADALAYLKKNPISPAEANFGFTTRVSVLLRLGMYDQILDEYHHPSARALALTYLGRDGDDLANARNDFLVGCVAAIDSVARGDFAGADSRVERLPRLLYEPDMAATDAIPAMVEAAAGHLERARARLERRLEPREAGQQRFWYLAAYVLGRIDDAEFLNQPVRFEVRQRLLMAKAFRSELQHDSKTALQCYRELVQTPLCRRCTHLPEELWVAMRLRQAGEPIPWNWGIQVLERN